MVLLSYKNYVLYSILGHTFHEHYCSFTMMVNVVSIADAAVREVKEETGIDAGGAHVLSGAYTPGSMYGMCHFVFLHHAAWALSMFFNI